MRDEFSKIEWLKARFELGDAPDGVLVGIGDDAAVFDFGGRASIVTIDTQVENVHFKPELISFGDLGRRAMVAAVSDVWAMGATPIAALAALTLPTTLAEHDFEALIEGMAEAATSTGARVIGGNLSGGSILSITTTAFGAPLGRPVTRRGARPGDSIYVTGTLGASALGLSVAMAKRLDLPGAQHFVERWRRPPINAHAARVISELATAAVDVSDGCLQDLRHLCRASEVGATLRADALPTDPRHVEVCTALGLDPRELALSGGEDYELLFTAPRSPAANEIATEVGVITEAVTVEVVDSDGRAVELPGAGFSHFS